VQYLLLVGDLGDGLGNAGIHIADEKADLIALDQLARLLDADADVVRRILDQELDGPPEDAALGIDLLGGKLGAHHFILCNRRINAGQGIDHTNSQGGLAACLDDEG
jgi:hypothetical protein